MCFDVAALISRVTSSVCSRCGVVIWSHMMRISPLFLKLYTYCRFRHIALKNAWLWIAFLFVIFDLVHELSALPLSIAFFVLLFFSFSLYLFKILSFLCPVWWCMCISMFYDLYQFLSLDRFYRFCFFFFLCYKIYSISVRRSFAKLLKSYSISRTFNNTFGS